MRAHALTTPILTLLLALACAATALAAKPQQRPGPGVGGAQYAPAPEDDGGGGQAFDDDLLPGELDDVPPDADDRPLPDADDLVPDALDEPRFPDVRDAPLPRRLPRKTVPGPVAKLGADGLARAPQRAPLAVKRAIWAANEIQRKPYVWGGGHASWRARGYDCSGAVSYLLRGGGLLRGPLTSGGLMRWGRAGRGRWITVYTHRSHAFAVVAGLRLDTSTAGDRRGTRGPRWRPAQRSTRGFVRRHPAGL